MTRMLWAVLFIASAVFIGSCGADVDQPNIPTGCGDVVVTGRLEGTWEREIALNDPLQLEQLNFATDCRYTAFWQGVNDAGVRTRGGWFRISGQNLQFIDRAENVESYRMEWESDRHLLLIDNASREPLHYLKIL